MKIESTRRESNLPEYLKMYNISGQDAITEHGFARYFKDRRQNDSIREQEENSPEFFTKKIRLAGEGERASLIRSGLESQNIEIQKACAGMIEWVSEKERASLIRSGLENPNFEVKKAYARMIFLAPLEEIDSLRNAILIKVRQAIESSDVELLSEYAGMIWWVPEKERVSLKNIILAKARRGLENPDIETQKALMGVIWMFPTEEKISLVKLGLKNPNTEIRALYAKLIHLLPLREKVLLKNTTLAKSSQDLENQNAEDEFIKTIWLAPDGERVSLIRSGLESQNIEIQKACARIIRFISELVPEEKRQELFDLIIEKGLGEELIKPSLLYENINIDNKTFSRQKFEKTGSRTTVIGGGLKNKTIIRHIKPEAFSAWQKAYEDYDLWKKEGFDYVPIEPIQSYRLNNTGLVDVFSGVLDINLRDWEKETFMFEKELEEQKNKILSVLKKLKIEHVHPNEGNFCLRFFRDEKTGKVDFKRIPRLYLIDFDIAISL